MSDLIKRSDVIDILSKHNAVVAGHALAAVFASLTGNERAKGKCDAYTVSLETATTIKDAINALEAVTA